MSGIGDIYRDIEKPYASTLGDFSKTVRFARIVDVFDASILDSVGAIDGGSSNYGKVSIIYLDSVGSSPRIVPFLTSWYSWTRGSGITFMPEQNDVVACLEQNNGYPIIIGFLPYKWNSSLCRLDYKQPQDDCTVRPLYKGEISIKSSNGGSIVLDKNGSIILDAVDPSVNNTVVSNVDYFNNETTFDKVLDNKKSGIARAVLGYSYYPDGTIKLVGNFPQIYECGTHDTKNASVSLPYLSEVEFTLSNDEEIVSILSVNILVYDKDNNLQKTIELDKSEYNLLYSNIYPICSNVPTNKSYKPACTDRNLIGYILYCNIEDVTDSSNRVIQLNYISKSFSGGIRVNEAGDVFIDGRNVVIRSENEKSSLSLNRMGEAHLKGVSTSMLGENGSGYVKCLKNGVTYSTGIAGTDGITKTVINDAENPIYFYIIDNMPLIKATFQSKNNWKFEAVTLDEYKGLSEDKKASISKSWFLEEPATLLTNDKLKSIMESDVPSYGDLKRLNIGD